MNKWVVVSVCLTLVVAVIFLVSGRNASNQNAQDYDLFSEIENDAELPEGQKANINEKLDLSKSENETMTTNAALDKPELTIDTSKTYKATLKTSEGDIVIQLNSQKTPITANNFVYLSENNFYDNTIFHRVIDGFMIQGGDPEGTGMGGPGYRFDDEPIEEEYLRGTVAMANSGPNTNGSQFFIMHKDYPLPKNYVIFGKVIEGIDVVDKIAQAEVKVSQSGEKSSPVNPVSISEVIVTSN